MCQVSNWSPRVIFLIIPQDPQEIGSYEYDIAKDPFFSAGVDDGKEDEEIEDNVHTETHLKRQFNGKSGQKKKHIRFSWVFKCIQTWWNILQRSFY